MGRWSPDPAYTHDVEMSTKLAVLLLFVCMISNQHGVNAAPGDTKLLCSTLRPMKGLSLDKLTGHWITLNELLFKDGVAAAPSTRKQSSTGDTGVRHNQCVHHEVSLLTDQGSSRLSWSPFFSFLRGHESKGSTFIVAGRANGRWRLLAEDGRSMQGGRMLVLDGDPDTYIVRAMCFPDNTPATREKRTPLVLKSITVESRRQSGQEGRGALGAEQMIEVKSRVARLLGLTEFKPAQFGLFC